MNEKQNSELDLLTVILAVISIVLLLVSAYFTGVAHCHLDYANKFNEEAREILKGERQWKP